MLKVGLLQIQMHVPHKNWTLTSRKVFLCWLTSDLKMFLERVDNSPWFEVVWGGNIGFGRSWIWFLYILSMIVCHKIYLHWYTIQSEEMVKKYMEKKHFFSFFRENCMQQNGVCVPTLIKLFHDYSFLFLVVPFFFPFNLINLSPETSFMPRGYGHKSWEFG